MMPIRLLGWPLEPSWRSPSQFGRSVPSTSCEYRLAPEAGFLPSSASRARPLDSAPDVVCSIEALRDEAWRGVRLGGLAQRVHQRGQEASPICGCSTTGEGGP